MKIQLFFRWLPTAIILWLFAIIFLLGAGGCALLALRAANGPANSHTAHLLASIGSSQSAARFYFRGAWADASVAVLCVIGWYLMRLRLKVTLAFGSFAVMAAAFIIGHRALIYLMRGASFENWVDIFLEQPFLAYAVIYACLACRKAAA